MAPCVRIGLLKTTPATFRTTTTMAFSPSSLNPAILNVQYAVRGPIATRAEEYRDRIKKDPNGHGLPFNQVVTANIGNPQQAGLDQKPLTFGRQVFLSPPFSSISSI